MAGFIFRVIAFLKWLFGFKTNPYVYYSYENLLPTLSSLCQERQATANDLECSQIFNSEFYESDPLQSN